MPGDWYCQIGEAVRGPLAAGDLKRMAEAGTLGPEDLVRRTEAGKWVPARLVKGLAFKPADAAAPGPLPTAEPEPPAETPHSLRRLVCPGCGCESRPGAALCVECGHDFRTGVRHGKARPQPEGRGRRGLVIAAGAVAGGLAVAGAVLFAVLGRGARTDPAPVAPDARAGAPAPPRADAAPKGEPAKPPRAGPAPASDEIPPGAPEWRRSDARFFEEVDRHRKGAAKFPATSFNYMGRGGVVPDEWEVMRLYGGRVEWEGAYEGPDADKLADRAAKVKVKGQPGLMLHVYPAHEAAKKWEALAPGSRVRYRATVEGIAGFAVPSDRPEPLVLLVVSLKDATPVPR